MLDAIRAAGQISRSALARETGINAATVTVAIRGLIHDGLVVESGRAASTGGKRPVLLALAAESRFAVGIHLDHNSTTYVVANLSGDIVARWPRRGGAAAPTPQLVVERMTSEVRAFLQRVDLSRARLMGIGLVSPGPATPSTAIALSSPEMRPWIDFPLADALATATGLPVVLGNDATAAAVGEYWTGRMDPAAVFAAVYMGVGIGAGIVASGRPLIGSSGNAGEIGHICVERDGKLCWCGAKGCLETVAGAAAIVAAAKAAGLDVAGEFVEDQFAAASRAALRGDPDAARVFDEAAEYIAVAVHALANILDLDRVILTGPSFAFAGPLFAPAIRRRLDLNFFARDAHRVEVAISANAAAAAAMGAAAMVLQSELAPRLSVPRRPALVSLPASGYLDLDQAGSGPRPLESVV
jgi:predicted NBD/HSP70 family sugar kinase